MNGPQHYAEAERLLDGVDAIPLDEVPMALAEAQVHATLALAAAQVTAASVGAGSIARLAEWSEALR